MKEKIRRARTSISFLVMVAFMLPMVISVYAGEPRLIGGYGVDLSCDDPYHNVKGGSSTTFIVQIKNTGTLDDTYEVTATSIEEIVCTVNGVNADQFTPYLITLQAGTSTTFEVTAKIGDVPEGRWAIIVSAYSQNDTNTYDYIELIVNVNEEDLSIKITQPTNGLYIQNKKIIPLAFPLVIGEIIIQARSSQDSIDRVEFYIDGEIRSVDYEAPYTWLWDEKIVGGHTVKAVAYDKVGNIATDEQGVWIFNP
ncbi:MAG: hypothetical protein FE048_01365 [Thermoplasmata archaeon]|nr:MAG: hypothetical protein FE048_01365 [Thermoplasmata archaeon]